MATKFFSFLIPIAISWSVLTVHANENQNQENSKSIVECGVQVKPQLSFRESFFEGLADLIWLFQEDPHLLAQINLSTKALEDLKQLLVNRPNILTFHRLFLNLNTKLEFCEQDLLSGKIPDDVREVSGINYNALGIIKFSHSRLSQASSSERIVLILHEALSFLGYDLEFEISSRFKAVAFSSELDLGALKSLPPLIINKETLWVSGILSILDIHAEQGTQRLPYRAWVNQLSTTKVKANKSVAGILSKFRIDLELDHFKVQSLRLSNPNLGTLQPAIWVTEIETVDHESQSHLKFSGFFPSSALYAPELSFLAPPEKILKMDFQLSEKYRILTAQHYLCSRSLPKDCVLFRYPLTDKTSIATLVWSLQEPIGR